MTTPTIAEEPAIIAAKLTPGQRAALRLCGTDYSKAPHWLLEICSRTPQREFKAFDGILWTRAPRRLLPLGERVRVHVSAEPPSLPATPAPQGE